MHSDPIADLLTRIRNAQLAKHDTCSVNVSKMNNAILSLLRAEGFIKDFKLVETGVGSYSVSLKYDNYGDAVIKKIKRYSTPGRREYRGVENLPRVQSGLGCVIVSTSQGVITDKEARDKNIGGEVLALVS